MPGEQLPVVGGRYRLIERLESDAMSEVWLAGDLGRNSRLVAAERLLRPGLAETDAAELDRGRREAEAVAGVRHPNVVRVIDYVVENGEPYVVMEYQAGDTVAELVARGGLPTRSAVTIMRQVAAGLAAVHRAGIVHRDVRPANIVVGPSGRAMITDFGIVLVGQDTRVTDTGLIAYRAPEVLEGAEPTAASDMWAFGACLYEVVEGRPAFGGERAPELMRAVVADPLPQTDRTALAAVIAGLLDRDPQARLTGEQAATALGQILAREDDLDARSAPVPTPEPAPEPASGPASGPEPGPEPSAEAVTDTLPVDLAGDQPDPARTAVTGPLPGPLPGAHDTLPLEFVPPGPPPSAGPPPYPAPGGGPPPGASAPPPGPPARPAGGRSRRRLTWLLVAAGVVVLLVIGAGVLLASVSSGGKKSGKAPPSSSVMTTGPTSTAGSAPTSPTGASTTPSGAGSRGRASQNLIDEISMVSETVSNTVGPGSVTGPRLRLSGPRLFTGDRPRIVYVGSEDCRLCAAQRWPLMITLARFGVFTGLSTVNSPGSMPAAGIESFSFHDTAYMSPTIDVAGYELNSTVPDGHGGYQRLDIVSARDRKALAKIPSQGAKPVIDIGGVYAFLGSSLNPYLLSGKGRDRIAGALRDPHSPLTVAILGAANLMTAAVCAVTHDAPAAVCHQPGIRSAAGLLPTR